MPDCDLPQVHRPPMHVMLATSVILYSVSELQFNTLLPIFTSAFSGAYKMASQHQKATADQLPVGMVNFLRSFSDMLTQKVASDKTSSPEMQSIQKEACRLLSQGVSVGEERLAREMGSTGDKEMIQCELNVISGLIIVRVCAVVHFVPASG